MHKRERHLAMLNDNRVVRPFEWGTEYVADTPNGVDPLRIFQKHSKRAIENSDEYFHLKEISDFSLSEPGNSIPAQNEDPANGSRIAYRDLTWTSPVTTKSAENNIARAKFFEHENDKKAAVVVLPHWNAQAGSYFDMCYFLWRFGVSALRLTLPYHEERMPPELERADYLVSPNVGRTIESVRQAVLETKAAVRWLRREGYQRVGVVGTSIGSCVAFLAFVHDDEIDAAVFNHVSGYMSDVVWRGLSTYHVREGLEKGISLEDLRECWLPLSPRGYLDKLAKMPERPQRYIYTLYDLSFPIDLTRETMKALDDHGIKHDEVSIPCGHYTLGEKPWVYLVGYKIISYLRKHLR